MGGQLRTEDRHNSINAIHDAVRYLERKGASRGTALWANVTVKFRGKTVLDDDRMKVQLHFDGGNTGQVSLYWNDYPNDEEEEVREEMHAKGFYGTIDYRWQKIKFVAPNTLYIEDTTNRYVYDVTLTFEEVGPVRRR